jgi:hypothetical protein
MPHPAFHPHEMLVALLLLPLPLPLLLLLLLLLVGRREERSQLAERLLLFLPQQERRQEREFVEGDP